MAQAKVERGGWARRWLTTEEREAAEKRWSARSYRFRADEDAQCGGCRYFAAPGLDYGICANPLSPLDGAITFEHGGCIAHSEIPVRTLDDQSA